MILFMIYILLIPKLKNSICNRTSYPNRVGLTTFPCQTYKGNLNFPNVGLFFNLGLLGEWGGFGFENLGFIDLGAGWLKAICSGFFSWGGLGLGGWVSAFGFMGLGTWKLSHKCTNGLPST